MTTQHDTNGSISQRVTGGRAAMQLAGGNSLIRRLLALAAATAGLLGLGASAMAQPVDPALINAPIDPKWTCPAQGLAGIARELDMYLAGELAPGVNLCGRLTYEIAPTAPITLLYSDVLKHSNQGAGSGVAIMDQLGLATGGTVCFSSMTRAPVSCSTAGSVSFPRISFTSTGRWLNDRLHSSGVGLSASGLVAGRAGYPAAVDNDGTFYEYLSDCEVRAYRVDGTELTFRKVDASPHLMYHKDWSSWFTYYGTSINFLLSEERHPDTGYVKTFTYDVIHHRLLKIEDNNGLVAQLAWVGNGTNSRLTSVTDRSGEVWTFTYQAQKLVSMDTPAGTVAFGYDMAGLLERTVTTRAGTGHPLGAQKWGRYIPYSASRTFAGKDEQRSLKMADGDYTLVIGAPEPPAADPYPTATDMEPTIIQYQGPVQAPLFLTYTVRQLENGGSPRYVRAAVVTDSATRTWEAFIPGPTDQTFRQAPGGDSWQGYGGNFLWESSTGRRQLRDVVIIPDSNDVRITVTDLRPGAEFACAGTASSSTCDAAEQSDSSKVSRTYTRSYDVSQSQPRMDSWQQILTYTADGVLASTDLTNQHWLSPTEYAITTTKKNKRLRVTVDEKLRPISWVLETKDGAVTWSSGTTTWTSGMPTLMTYTIGNKTYSQTLTVAPGKGWLPGSVSTPHGVTSTTYDARGRVETMQAPGVNMQLEWNAADRLVATTVNGIETRVTDWHTGPGTAYLVPKTVTAPGSAVTTTMSAANVLTGGTHTFGTASASVMALVDGIGRPTSRTSTEASATETLTIAHVLGIYNIGAPIWVPSEPAVTPEGILCAQKEATYESRYFERSFDTCWNSHTLLTCTRAVANTGQWHWTGKKRVFIDVNAVTFAENLAFPQECVECQVAAATEFAYTNDLYGSQVGLPYSAPFEVQYVTREYLELIPGLGEAWGSWSGGGPSYSTNGVNLMTSFPDFNGNLRSTQSPWIPVGSSCLARMKAGMRVPAGTYWSGHWGPGGTDRGTRWNLPPGEEPEWREGGPNNDLGWWNDFDSFVSKVVVTHEEVCGVAPACNLNLVASCDGPADLAECGDGACTGGEDCKSCSADCGRCEQRCGNGTCDRTESCDTCTADCGECPDSCGNGTCDATESCSTCPSECGACPPSCGDGSCNGTESCSTCTADCAACAGCGDGSCVSPESPQNCAADCGVSTPTCGDATCAAGEDCDSCQADCGECPVQCGDGVCHESEEPSYYWWECTYIGGHCEADCGGCPPGEDPGY